MHHASQYLNLVVTVVSLLVLPGCIDSAHSDPPESANAALVYPEAIRGDQVDTYHGREVADPYRWMEEDSPETRTWIDAQVTLFDDYVSGSPSLDGLRHRIGQIRDFDRYSVPIRRGDRYFFTHNPAGRNHGRLHVQKGLKGKPRLLIDFAEAIDNESHSAGGFAPSPDGRHVVWSSQGPSSWGWLEIVDLDGTLRSAERIEGIASGAVIWTHDNRGFFYQGYGDYDELVAGEAAPQARILYHRLGTPQADDREVYARDDRPTMLFSPKLSDDGRYLVVELYDGTSKKNQVVYRDLQKTESSFVTLIADANAGYTFEGNVGTRFLFWTTLDAPRGRVVAVDLDRPARESWTEVIAERESTLVGASHIGGRLVVRSTIDARPVVEIFRTNGQLERTLELPGIGGVYGFNDDPASSTAFYGFNTLHDPGTVYRVDLTTGKSRIWRRPELSHDPDTFEIRQVFYESADGTRVPMFVAHKKGLKLDGKRPAFMYGYGHGGWVAFPWFQPHLVAWMEMGGVYALPGLRGGGEYGAEWQEAGTRRNKQNTIDDFVAAAEWLVEHDYTSPSRLVANGGSASGVLAAAAVVQRPDLFGAALVEWPFLDMLRYHEYTRFKGWTSGYGESGDADDFEVLRRYSPLHNLKAGACYPPMLTVVGEADASTVPMHGYKFTAALQENRQCAAPSLLKFIPGGGHYRYGTDPVSSIEGQAEVLAFLVRALELETPAR